MISLHQHYNVEGRSSCGIKLVIVIEIKTGMKVLYYVRVCTYKIRVP